MEQNSFPGTPARIGSRNRHENACADTALPWKRTARLHRRARIETPQAKPQNGPALAPPAFTGGRGLKLTLL